MGIQWKSLASAIAIGFALLAFGPATSTAKADHLIIQAGVAPAGYYSARPYHRYAYAYPRPYRVVRVFAPLPFPHWVYRRLAYGYGSHASYGPYAGAYRPY
jgi:hypothetical protein